MISATPLATTTVESVPVSSLLTPQRIDVGCQVSSKKRLLERMAELLVDDVSELSTMTVFQTLVERERLGSTGVGKGVGLPHGRIAGLDNAVGAVAVLERPLDYEAADRQPVKLVFGLLVPKEANEQHLRILASLARLFSDAALRDSLIRAQTADQVYQLLSSWEVRDT